jgi:transposase
LLHGAVGDLDVLTEPVHRDGPRKGPFGAALSVAARSCAVPTAAGPGAGSLAITNAPAVTGGAQRGHGHGHSAVPIDDPLAGVLGNGCVGVGSTDEAREAVRQVRVFATGNGRKSDPVDAHSVAMAALHTPSLLRVEVDDDLVVMGMLVDRRDELGRTRTQTVNRLHGLLLELSQAGRRSSCPRGRRGR